MKTFSLGSTCMLPWLPERIFGWVYWRSSVAVMASSSTARISPRESFSTAGVAPLSNRLSVPSARRRASCCQAKLLPRVMSKLPRLPPRRQRISPEQQYEALSAEPSRQSSDGVEMDAEKLVREL